MTRKIIFIFLGIILSSSFCFAAETVTITTYYPAPYGVYNVLRLNPHDNYTPGAACTNRGEMYYDNSDSQVYICNGTWQASGGGSFWAASGNNIYNTNTGNVGIGNTAPAFRLQLGTVNSTLDGGILAMGSDGDGTTDIWSDAFPENPYLIWYPERGAFRVGHRGTYAPSGVDGWALANIGLYSIAMGNEPTALGTYSVAIGDLVRAEGNSSLALGRLSNATSETSISLGHLVTSSATNSIVIGAGYTGPGSFRLVNGLANSLMVGFQSDVPTFFVGPSAGTSGSTGSVGIATSSPTAGFKLEVNGKIRSTYPPQFSGALPAANRALCIKASGDIGSCSTAVSATGTCTCN